MCVVPYGTVLLPYFISQGEAGSGLLVLTWPSFSPVGWILEEKLPDGAGFWL